MRLRIKQPPSGCIDGIRLDDLIEGLVYEIGTTLGCYLLAQGVAEPADDASTVHVPPWNQIRFSLGPASEPPEDSGAAALSELSKAADRPPRPPRE